MNARRKNISIHPAVLERAADLMGARAINNFSELLATLIREEYDRRQPPPAEDLRIHLAVEELHAATPRKRRSPANAPKSASPAGDPAL
jgi:hypothetical protein